VGVRVGGKRVTVGGAVGLGSGVEAAPLQPVSTMKARRRIAVILCIKIPVGSIVHETPSPNGDSFVNSRIDLKTCRAEDSQPSAACLPDVE
jgi:hypothetical protein